MLRRFPNIPASRFLEYCTFIIRSLDKYDELKDVASSLELALWKSKIAEQYSHLSSTDNRDPIRSEARKKCGDAVIIPIVLSFLVRSDCVEDFANYFEKDLGTPKYERFFGVEDRA